MLRPRRRWPQELLPVARPCTAWSPPFPRSLRRRCRAHPSAGDLVATARTGRAAAARRLAPRPSLLVCVCAQVCVCDDVNPVLTSLRLGLLIPSIAREASMAHHCKNGRPLQCLRYLGPRC